MKKMSSIFKALVVIILILNCNYGFAQEGHYYEVTTWKLQVPENGTRAEMNNLMKEFSEKVVFKNDKIISQKVMHHISGADLRDVVIISQYASWNDIDAAGNMQNQLINEAWPTEEGRDNFFKAWGKYVITHADEIYQETPELAKK